MQEVESISDLIHLRIKPALCRGYLGLRLSSLSDLFSGRCLLPERLALRQRLAVLNRRYPHPGSAISDELSRIESRFRSIPAMMARP
jgi:hypothetical protein